MAKPPFMALKISDSPQLFKPDFGFEQTLIDSGLSRICGLDEAGRGPLAGPVVAAAVVLNSNDIPEGLNDSKKLTHSKREALFAKIMQSAEVSIASVSAASIDQLNIRAASLYAMRMAIQGLAKPADHALIDGNALPDHMPCSATAIIKGDARSLSIAAASIIAKVTRDKMMVRAAAFYDGYGMEGHKGYPTKAHRSTVLERGPTNFHRLTFAPVKVALEKHGTLQQDDSL